jgi:DNA-binding MarR family transcriptional regulator
VDESIRSLHRSLLDLAVFLNRPQRDRGLLREANVSLDRALFPLLTLIGRYGPVGVVELGELVGRDYTTVSRQLAKLEHLGLVRRSASTVDGRKRSAAVTASGRRMTRALDEARGRLASVVFAEWSERDLQALVRLMRRFADDLRSLPVSEPTRETSSGSWRARRDSNPGSRLRRPL